VYTYPNGEIISDNRIFVLNADGTRGSAWSVLNGELNGEFRIRNNDGGTRLLSKYVNRAG
jgi:hypothetical protein